MSNCQRAAECGFTCTRKKSEFSQLKMQSQDEDFMRNLIRNYFRDFAFLSILKCKIIFHTMMGFVLNL